MKQKDGTGCIPLQKKTKQSFRDRGRCYGNHGIQEQRNEDKEESNIKPTITNSEMIVGSDQESEAESEEDQMQL